MKIEVWSDIICPWCGLGSHRLKKALAILPQGSQIEVIYRSFMLDPNFPEGQSLAVREMLARKYGMSEFQVQNATNRIEALASAEGLTPYVVLENAVGNTRLTHEFLAYASEQGKNVEAWEHMYRVYFGQAKPVFEREQLQALAADFGLDVDGVGEVFASRRFRQQVSDEMAQAQQMGASGVPFFVLDGRYAIPGAQDVETMLSIMRRVWGG